MANIFEPTDAIRSAWAEWVAGRPPTVRAICEKVEPWKLYRLEPPGQYVTFYSCNEDGTVTVDVSSEWNGPIVVDRRVFGIDPKDLSECELPDPDHWKQ